jgi:hypothetical protein
MRGDVGALKRMERQNRQADKSSRRLIKKLARTPRNQQRESFARVQPCPWEGEDYNMWHDAIVHPSVETALRRVTLAREPDGRSFLVSPIVDGLEDVIAILAIPKSASATPEKLARALLKVPEPETPMAVSHETFGRLSRRRLPLFCTDESSSTPLRTGATTGTHLFARKLHVRDGGTPIYYAQTEDPEGDYATPRDMKVDGWLYRRLLSVAADVMGVELMQVV